MHYMYKTLNARSIRCSTVRLCRPLDVRVGGWRSAPSCTVSNFPPLLCDGGNPYFPDGAFWVRNELRKIMGG